MQTGDNIYRGGVVRISAIAGDFGGLEGFVFEGCEIRGPAILVPQGSAFTGSSFMGDPDAWLWEIPPERTEVVGAILVRDCTFDNCTFVDIGLAGTSEFVHQIKRSLDQR